MSLAQYLHEIENHWNNKDGYELAELLSLRDSHTMNINLRVEYPDSVVNNIIYDSYVAEMVILHIRCIYFLSKNDIIQAHSEMNKLFNSFNKTFQYYTEENWLLGLMNTFCVDLRLLSGQVDSLASTNTVKTGMQREALEKAAETVMGSFRICSSDNRASETDTKKWGMMAIVNQLFKLYFRINKLHLMKPLIRAIDSSHLKEKFPLSQQITYRYYVGRKAMFDSDYSLANENLSFAFEKCHKESKRNKHLILIYLVPLKMLLGYLPRKKLLEKYELLPLWEVAEAVRIGNARKLTEAIEAHQSFFIKSGIYLILERLRFITYRNLFKKVYLLEKKPIIAIEDFLAALMFTESDEICLEEANCILANLIHQGKIKGYLSHGHQKVVLSKTDPFPKLTSLVP